MNKTEVLAGLASTVTFEGLLPNSTYVLCYTYESADGMVSNVAASCANFTTDDIEYPVIATQTTFQSPLTAAQRNRLLCFVVNDLGVDPSLVVNLRGESCLISGTAPVISYYKYTGGETLSASTTTETIYLFANTSDAAAAGRFEAWFSGGTTMNSTQLASISSFVKVAAVSGANLGSSTELRMRTNSTRSVTTGTAASYSNGTVTLSGIQMSGGPGVVYVAVAPSTAANITAESVLNCKSSNPSNSTPLLSCQRVVLTGNQMETATASLPVSSSSGAVLYVAATTDYVPRPIIVNNTASAVLTSLPIVSASSAVAISPSSISVAAGTCKNITITLDSLPTSDVGVGFTTTTTNNTASGISLTGATAGVINFTSAGSLSKSVQVCAATATPSGTITYAVQMSGTDAANYTSSQNSVTVAVTNLTDITIPPSITVVKGACSTGVVLTAVPISDVTLSFSSAATSGGSLRINNATSNTLTFLPSATTQNLTVCAAANASTAVIPIALTGTDAGLFTVNGANSTSLTVNVVSGNSTSQTLSIANASILGTTGTALLSSPSTGTVYYTVSQANSTAATAPLGLEQVMTYVSNSSGPVVVQGKNDYLTYSFTTPRYLVAGSTAVVGNSTTTLTLSDL